MGWQRRRRRGRRRGRSRRRSRRGRSRERRRGSRRGRSRGRSRGGSRGRSSEEVEDYSDYYSKKYVFVKEKKTWTAAKDYCQSIGAKLAEPDTTEAVDYLGETTNLKDGGPFWLGGSCNGCSDPADDRWHWDSGERLNLNYPAWREYNGKKTPYDQPGSHDAKYLT